MEIVNFNHRDDAFKQLVQHQPFQSFDVYFEKANHLLGDYTGLPSDIGPYGVLKSYDGSTFAVYPMNCGYGGYGPHQTYDMLVWLGVDGDIARQWIDQPGIHVEFDIRGVWQQSSLRLGALFDNREHEKPDVLIESNSIFPALETRTIYFVNPQRGKYNALFRTLQVCSPAEFTYYYGNNAEKHISYDEIFNFDFHRNRELQSLAQGGFVCIHGKRFDVICLAGEESIASLIQNLYCFFFGEELFFETRIGDLTLLSEEAIKPTFKTKLKLIWNALRWPVPKELYESKLLPEKPREPFWGVS